jgi:hypothetical protein
MNTHLSTAELELVTNAEVLLTKNRIIQKVFDKFGVLSEAYKKELTNHSLLFTIPDNPKISRGENYSGLPYVMLDYPRLFSRDDTFAIRTFFWWGNFFSITLQLEGSYQNMYCNKLDKAIKEGKFSEWYVAISDDRWQHQFDEHYYIHLEKVNDITPLPFIKLAKKIPLNKWDESEKFLLENFTTLMQILST